MIQDQTLVYYSYMSLIMVQTRYFQTMFLLLKEFKVRIYTVNVICTCLSSVRLLEITIISLELISFSMPDKFPQVCSLTSGHFYQFRVFAANVAGVGKPSKPSEAFLCEMWTMPEPGEDNMSVHFHISSLRNFISFCRLLKRYL